MSKEFAIAVVKLLIYIVEYLNNVSMRWDVTKAEKLLDGLKDEVIKLKGLG